MLNQLLVREAVTAALREDIGTGDITTQSTISPDALADGRYIAKEAGVICGLQLVETVFAVLDPSIVFHALVRDGDRVCKGDVIATVSGHADAILMGERVSLNYLQHLCGIATYTAGLVQQVSGTKAAITDTRKTIPGLRAFEKYAVKTGGGANHRFNLADGVLIKDNHIAAAGGIQNAVSRARKNVPHTLKIEVEVENFDMLAEALEAGADIIMLDNMSNDQMRQAVEIVAGRALTEASGNMDEKDLREVAATGVDIISIGALTRNVRAMDISLKFAK